MRGVLSTLEGPELRKEIAQRAAAGSGSDELKLIRDQAPTILDKVQAFDAITNTDRKSWKASAKELNER